MNKELLLRQVIKNVESTNDLKYIIDNLDRIYLDNRIQEQITKIFYNRIYAPAKSDKTNSDFAKSIAALGEPEPKDTKPDSES